MDLKEFSLEKHFLVINDRIDNTMSKNVIDFFNNAIVDDTNVNKWNENAINYLYKNIEFKPEFPSIEINLNSPGGAIKEGLSIYDTIELYTKTYNIDMICSGAVSSAASFIMLAVPFENRFCTKNTTFLIHQGSTITYGTLKDLSEDVNELKRLNELVFNIYTSKTKITSDKLNDVYEKKYDWIITANEAVELGLVKEIL